MTFSIGKTDIQPASPVYVIAEGCDNHMGDVAVAKEMCVQAKRAGADAIKFQHHLPDEEMLPDTPMSSNMQEPLYDFLKKYALSLEEHRELIIFCREAGIQYLCTPFSYKAAEEMVGIGLETIKIGSGEMTDVPSLVRMAKTFGKPMIVSTGMSSYEEIDRTYQALVETNIPLALLNCVSEYPAEYEDINLNVIRGMKNRYPHAIIGHSDHTLDIYTSFAAVALGARIIEKHVILDKNTPGPDQEVSLNFDELAELVCGIRKIEVALGSEKKVHEKEVEIREWAFRSIVSLGEIKAGAVIDEGMIWSKRPGTGIPSHHRNEVLGRTAQRDIKANQLLVWEDVSGEPIL